MLGVSFQRSQAELYKVHTHISEVSNAYSLEYPYSPPAPPPPNAWLGGGVTDSLLSPLPPLLPPPSSTSDDRSLYTKASTTSQSIRIDRLSGGTVIACKRGPDPQVRFTYIVTRLDTLGGTGSNPLGEMTCYLMRSGVSRFSLQACC